MNKSQLLQSLKQKNFPKHILNAFSKVKREDFVPPDMKERAYEDVALSIGENQTISQPYTIAMMLSLLDLKKRQKVLEIGSGCGYVLALLSEIVGNKGKIFGVEIIKTFFKNSAENLKSYRNVLLYNRNGVFGLEEESPFDRVLISAACSKIPSKISLQLKEKGFLVAPVGSSYSQSLTKIQNFEGKFLTRKKIPGFIFVPFVLE